MFGPLSCPATRVHTAPPASQHYSVDTVPARTLGVIVLQPAPQSDAAQVSISVNSAPASTSVRCSSSKHFGPMQLQPALQSDAAPASTSVQCSFSQHRIHEVPVCISSWLRLKKWLSDTGSFFVPWNYTWVEKNYNDFFEEKKKFWDRNDEFFLNNWKRNEESEL